MQSPSCPLTCCITQQTCVSLGREKHRQLRCIKYVVQKKGFLETHLPFYHAKEEERNTCTGTTHSESRETYPRYYIRASL